MRQNQKNLIYEGRENKANDTDIRFDIQKKFVRYREGAELYSIGLTKFQELAHHAGAVHKIGGISLVNCETFETYLEQFVV